MSDEDRLQDLIGRWRDEQVSPEVLCAGCPELVDELKRRIDKLLAMDRLVGSSGEATRSEAVASEAAPLPQVAGYDVLGEIGQGGMGVVYKARHRELNRLVAIKMIRAGMLAGATHRTRFEAEARAVARLRHPHIVQIYDVGTWQGQPFFTMELVEGGSLDRVLASSRRSPREAAELVEILARAMQHSHAHGIIHRDLKPANVLLSFNRDAESSERSAAAVPAGPTRAQSALRSEDSASRFACHHSQSALRSEDSASRLNNPKIADFGLAKLLDQSLGATQTTAVIGTPSYMAPEQADGKSKEVGPATDIHALGVILYEVLTGRPPYLGDSTLSTLKLVKDQPPISPRQLRADVPRDLETICLKCLAKEPKRRYASAEALAADLRRFLANEPIRARPVSSWERARKWVRRNAVVTGLAAGIVLALTLGLAGTGWQWRRAEAELAASTADLYSQRLAAYAAAYQENRGRDADVLLEQCPLVLRGWEWRFAKNRLWACDRLHEEIRDPSDLVMTPDGRQIYLGNGQGLWALDLGTGTKPKTPARARTKWSHSPLCIAPTGMMLATQVSLCAVDLVDVNTWQTVATLSRPDGQDDDPTQLTTTCFSSDGGLLAIGHQDGLLLVWDVAARRVVFERKGGHRARITSLAFSKDSTRLLSAAGGTPLAKQDKWEIHGEVKVWGVRENRELHVFPRTGLDFVAAAFSADDQKVTAITQTKDNRLPQVSQGFIWAIPTGQVANSLHEERRLLDRGWRFWAVRFLPDGQSYVSVDRFCIRWVDCKTDSVRNVIRSPGEIHKIVLSPDGRTVHAACLDGRIRSWTLERPQDAVVIRDPAEKVKRQVVFHPRGALVAVASDDTTVRTYRVDDGRWTNLELPHGDVVSCLAYSQDGSLIATGCWDNQVRLWDTNGKGVTMSYGHAQRVLAIAFDPSGAYVYSGGKDGRLLLWDLTTRTSKTLHEAANVINVITSVAVSPDGKMLAAAIEHVGVKVWRLPGGEPLWSYAPSTALGCCTFSRDSKRLAVAGSGITMLDARTGAVSFQMPAHSGEMVTSLAFSPDGQRLASGGKDWTVRLWHVGPHWPARHGRETFTFRDPRGGVESVAFSPDGGRLAASDWAGEVRIWDGRPWSAD